MSASIARHTLLLLFALLLATPPAQASTYEEQLAQLDERIAAWQERTDAQASSWDAPTRLAASWLERARLSGEHGDYDEAMRATRLAFERAPGGAGPFLFRAGLYCSLHRLTAASADLDRAERALLLDDRTRARIAALRGEIAMQRGDFERAEAHFTAAQVLSPGFSPLARRAHARWQAGKIEAAEAGYGEAEAALLAPAPDLRAWLELQRGILDLERGELDAALAHYQAAAEHFPGWPKPAAYARAIEENREDPQVAIAAARARD